LGVAHGLSKGTGVALATQTAAAHKPGLQGRQDRALKRLLLEPLHLVHHRAGVRVHQILHPLASDALRCAAKSPLRGAQARLVRLCSLGDLAVPNALHRVVGRDALLGRPCNCGLTGLRKVGQVVGVVVRRCINSGIGRLDIRQRCSLGDCHGYLLAFRFVSFR